MYNWLLLLHFKNDNCFRIFESDIERSLTPPDFIIGDLECFISDDDDGFINDWVWSFVRLKLKESVLNALLSKLAAPTDSNLKLASECESISSLWSLIKSCTRLYLEWKSNLLMSLDKVYQRFLSSKVLDIYSLNYCATFYFH